MPSPRNGLASHFSETVNPFPAAQVPIIAIVARGVTDDGARFMFQAATSGVDPICSSSDRPQQEVLIRFW